MKYFTKDIYKTELLADHIEFLKQSRQAEQKDESYYLRIYNENRTLYLRNESMSDLYCDPQEELQKMEEYVSAPNLSAEEQAKRRQFAKMFRLFWNASNTERKTVYPFDEETAKGQFAVRQERQIEICKRLPKEIKEEIADIRVFALGYASAELKRKLRPYGADLRRTVQKAKEKARRETEAAEEYLTEKLGIDEYDDCLLTGMEQSGDDLILRGDEETGLRIENGIVFEGRGKPIYSYRSDIPNDPWSKIVAAELHRVEGQFELHFLVSNRNELDEEDLWYLTIRGTDVSEIIL